MRQERQRGVCCGEPWIGEAGVVRSVTFWRCKAGVVS